MSAAVSGCSFRVFADALGQPGGVVKAIRVPDGARISNSRLKTPKGDVVAEAIAAGAGACTRTRCCASACAGACSAAFQTHTLQPFARMYSFLRACCSRSPAGPLPAPYVGAGGLAFLRVGAAGAIDAAKPLREGLSPEQTATLLAATQAQEVRSTHSAHRPQRMLLSSLPHLRVSRLTAKLDPLLAC